MASLLGRHQDESAAADRASKALTQDMIHVLLDTIGDVEGGDVEELARQCAEAYRYGDEPDPDDPKTTTEGWLDQFAQAKKVLTTALDKGWTLGNAGVL